MLKLKNEAELDELCKDPNKGHTYDDYKSKEEYFKGIVFKDLICNHQIYTFFELPSGQEISFSFRLVD